MRGIADGPGGPEPRARRRHAGRVGPRPRRSADSRRAPRRAARAPGAPRAPARGDRGAAPAARDARHRRGRRRAGRPCDRGHHGLAGLRRGAHRGALDRCRRAARGRRGRPARRARRRDPLDVRHRPGAGLRERQPAAHAAPRAPPDAAAAGLDRRPLQRAGRRDGGARPAGAGRLAAPAGGARRGRAARRPRPQRQRGPRRRPHAPRDRDPAAARRRAHEPCDRRRARDLRWNREVPRQQHPAQAARGEPRRGRRALLRAPGPRR